MNSDFETMPVGTAALLRETAKWLRVEHSQMIGRFDHYREQRDQADGWRREAAQESMDKVGKVADAVAERIGAIEALLDRCPHAPPLEPIPADGPGPQIDDSTR